MPRNVLPESRPYPFVKWAGGKRSLAVEILARLPARIDTFVEPFLGGGAIFLALAREGRLKRARLSDRNPELVTTWTAVRDAPEAVIEAIEAIGPADEARYYAVRQQEAQDPVGVAARLIWLNRNCFNGLYRLNRAGGFNVPYGRYARPQRVDHENLRAVSAALNACQAELRVTDFESALAEPLGARDAVYCDPPYLPLSATSRFTSYDRTPFGLPEHERLAVAFAGLGPRGVPALLSNADTPVARALYEAQGLVLTEVTVARSISRDGATRGKVQELLAAPPRRTPRRARDGA